MDKGKMNTIYYNPADLTQVFDADGNPVDGEALGLPLVNASMAKRIDRSSEALRKAVQEKALMIRKAREALKKLGQTHIYPDSHGPYIERCSVTETGEERGRLAFDIIDLLNGMAMGEALSLLEETRCWLLDCHEVNTSNPRFTAKVAEAQKTLG